MPNPSPLMCKEAFLVFCNYHWISSGMKIPMDKETYQKGMEIEEYAKDHRELAEAIEFFRKKKTK